MQRIRYRVINYFSIADGIIVDSKQLVLNKLLRTEGQYGATLRREWIVESRTRYALQFPSVDESALSTITLPECLSVGHANREIQPSKASFRYGFGARDSGSENV